MSSAFVINETGLLLDYLQNLPLAILNFYKVSSAHKIMAKTNGRPYSLLSKHPAALHICNPHFYGPFFCTAHLQGEVIGTARCETVYKNITRGIIESPNALLLAYYRLPDFELK